MSWKYGEFKKKDGKIQVIHYIKGMLAVKLPSGIVIEAGGIGYDITVPVNSPFFLKNEGEEVCCYIHMAVREDDIRLYGFSDDDALSVFRMLLTVNGVGAKAAVAVLSVMSPSEFRSAVAIGDDKKICEAQGIGRKTAQRIVLELKDKVGNIEDTVAREISPVGNADAHKEAIEALTALGYSKQEAVEALKGIEADDSETYIKKALKNLF